MARKPDPLMVDGRPYYTLSSYDPVKVTVDIPHVTEEDVDYMAELMCQVRGGTAKDLRSPAWLKEHLGVESEDELRQMARAFIEDADAGSAEQQKANACSAELAGRLNQSVPAADVQAIEQQLRLSLEQELQQRGLTTQEFCSQSGIRPSDLDASIGAQAAESAQEAAALDAVATKCKLKVSDDELAGLLGIPEEDAQSVLSQARAAGRMDDLRAAALRSKALQTVVAECVCTYHHETAEEAQVRRREAEARLGVVPGSAAPGGQTEPADGGKPDGPTGTDGRPKLHLV